MCLCVFLSLFLFCKPHHPQRPHAWYCLLLAICYRSYNVGTECKHAGTEVSKDKAIAAESSLIYGPNISNASPANILLIPILHAVHIEIVC